MTERNARPGGNLVALGLVQAFRMGAGAAVNVLVMRTVGVEGFGVFAYITTLVGLLGFLATMGMDRLLKRELARAPESAPRWVGAGLAASAGLAVVSAVAVLGWAFGVDGRPLVVTGAGLAALALGLQAMASIPTSYFHAIGRMSLATRPSALGRATLVVTAAGLLAAGFDLRAVFVAQVLDGLVTLVAVGWVWGRLPNLGAPTVALPDVRRLLADSVPFGLNALFGSIYLTSSVVLLALFSSETEAGLFRAAVLLLTLFPIVAETLSNGLYPRMARHLGDPAAARRDLEFAARVLLALSVPAAVGGVLLAEPLMVLMGGAPYAAAALPFAILAPVLPLRFLNNATGMTLTALDHQGARTRGVMLAAVLNVAANVYVLPRYGAAGAAATTLATEALLAGWLQLHVAPLVPGLRFGPALLRVAGPAAAMAGVLRVLPQAPVLLLVALGAGVFLGLGRVTGAWAPTDLRELRRV